MDIHQKKIHAVMEQVNQVILGKETEVREMMLAFLADGHILLEDIPGVGKTTLALAFSRAMELDYKRVQFTPDVMPSDLTGFSVYRRDKEKFVYQPGVVFCNLLLADELNRTSPKTQSALLEVMEERKVSVEGETREVPRPFFVVATQNPFGSAGTQPLPEAQVDRFMISMTLGYPDFDSELAMAMEVGEIRPLDLVRPILNRPVLLEIQKEIHSIYIREKVYRYLLELITATRENPYLERGASPRATIALVKMARAAAWLEGRSYVTPADVKEQFPYVVSHRLRESIDGKMEQLKVYDYLALFSASRKIRQELTVAAFPSSQPMRMEYPEALWRADTDSREQVVNGRGDGTGEIRQLREYRPEDSWRHIHWNQSARTGRLWIKEYEEETNGMAVLGLEMQKEHRNSLSDMDCFYRLLSSMVLGFLQQSVRLCVYWFDSEKGCVREMEIFSQEQHRELLLQLYQLSAAEEGGTQEKEMLLRRGALYGSFFLLDTGLGWYKNGKLFHQFSGENLEQEIEQRVFTL